MKRFGCLTIITTVLTYWIVGTWSVIEILSWFGKSIPTIACFILVLLTGYAAIPIAIIGCILRAFNVF